MDSMKHRGLTLSDMFNTFFANYGYDPGEKERGLHLEWAKHLDQRLLARVLDPVNHNVSKSGQVMKPNLATLKYLARNLIATDPSYYKPSEYEPTEPMGCPYCVDGIVHDLRCIDTIWNDVEIGECAECSGGTERPIKEICEIADRNELSCVEVIAHIMISILIDTHKCGKRPDKKAVSNIIRAYEKKRLEKYGG